MDGKKLDGKRLVADDLGRTLHERAAPRITGAGAAAAPADDGPGRYSAPGPPFFSFSLGSGWPVMRAASSRAVLTSSARASM